MVPKKTSHKKNTKQEKNTQDEQEKLFQDALVSFSKGEYRDTIKKLKKITAPQLNALRSYYIGLAYTNLGEFEEALESYRRILQLDLNETPMMEDFLYGLYINMGSLFHKVGRKNKENKKLYHLEDAIKCYTNALKIKDYDARVWNNLGNAYLDIEEFEKAEECFKEALMRDDEFPEAHYCLSLIYEHQGELEKAEKELDQAMKWRNRNKIFLRNATYVALKQGKIRKAKETAKRLIDYYPTDTELMENLLIRFEEHASSTDEQKEVQDYLEKKIGTSDFNKIKPSSQNQENSKKKGNDDKRTNT